MAIETNFPIFCPCGGVWLVKKNNDEKMFVCPICGLHKDIPEDTSRFQINLE